MPVDNSDLIRPFVPTTDDGDTFSYTEILDRTANKGNNGTRLLRTFYHRSHDDFDRHLPAIQSLCNHTGARAYTRLSTRSLRRAGKLFCSMVVEAALTDNWLAMKTLYSSACAKSKPVTKYWMFDVDDTSMTPWLLQTLEAAEVLYTIIPSRTGHHVITKPFNPNPNLVGNLPDGKITRITDSNTNLWIPDGFQEHNK